jgi:hypothetical protein
VLGSSLANFFNNMPSTRLVRKARFRHFDAASSQPLHGAFSICEDNIALAVGGRLSDDH